VLVKVSMLGFMTLAKKKSVAMNMALNVRGRAHARANVTADS